MSGGNALRRWAKQSNSPGARLVRRLRGATRDFEVPVWRPFHQALFWIHHAARGIVAWTMRVFYWTPLFKSRLAGPAPRLYLYGGMPLVTGGLRISLGEGCRVSGQTTFSARAAGNRTPLLEVGDNVGIGWQTTIAVGARVVLGDNVRIGGRAYLAGYPGHPLNPRDRAAGLPDTEDQVGDIILEDDAWLGVGVTVSAGVTIGSGTIVAAGSVVSRDLPPGVLAGGVPARVIRHLLFDDLKAVS